MFDNLGHHSFPDQRTNFSSYHSSQNTPNYPYHASSSSANTTRYRPEPPTTTPVIPRPPSNGRCISSPPVGPDRNATKLSPKQVLQAPSLLPPSLHPSPILRAASPGNISPEQLVLTIKHPFSDLLPACIDEERLLDLLQGKAEKLRVENVSVEDFKKLERAVEGSPFAAKWEKVIASRNSCGIMILEVPVSGPHEAMMGPMASLGEGIRNWHRTNADATTDIHQEGSQNITLTNGSSYQPDWSIRLIKRGNPSTSILFPTAVLECAFSQEEAVNEKCAEMVMFSAGCIKVAIVVNYEFSPSRKVQSVTWSYWSLAHVANINEDKTKKIRRMHGVMIPIKSEEEVVTAYKTYTKDPNGQCVRVVAKRSTPIQIYPASQSRGLITVLKRQLYDDCDDNDETVIASIEISHISNIIEESLRKKDFKDQANPVQVEKDNAELFQAFISRKRGQDDAEWMTDEEESKDEPETKKIKA